jgi:ATP/maltotriose-dependent transcriptional regulator MalT
MSEYSNLINKLINIGLILNLLLGLNLFLFFLFYTQEKFKKFEKEIKEKLDSLNLEIKNLNESLYFGIYKISAEKLQSDIKAKELKEKEILELYNNGISIENISQKLNIPLPEVEFIIKINKLKNNL